MQVSDDSDVETGDIYSEDEDKQENLLKMDQLEKATKLMMMMMMMPIVLYQHYFILIYYYKRTISKYDIPSINIIYHQIY